MRTDVSASKHLLANRGNDESETKKLHPDVFVDCVPVLPSLVLLSTLYRLTTCGEVCGLELRDFIAFTCKCSRVVLAFLLFSEAEHLPSSGQAAQCGSTGVNYIQRKEQERKRGECLAERLSQKGTR